MFMYMHVHVQQAVGHECAANGRDATLGKRCSILPTLTSSREYMVETEKSSGLVSATGRIYATRCC